MVKKLLILLTALVMCLSGCKSSVPPAAEPEISASAAEGWQPYYTGGERSWDLEYPWANLSTQTHSFDQDQGLDAYFAMSGMESESDYGGCYINNSGTLTVLITDPTMERAEYYAGLCDVGFWIIEAQYTYAELQAARDNAWDLISSWLTENPQVALTLNSAGIRETDNRVEIHLSGSDRAALESSLDLPDCVYLDVYETASMADRGEIPYEPVSRWSSGDISIYLDQSSFPPGVENINITLENRSEGSLLYGKSFSIDKYVDGQWVSASGDLVFTAEGYTLDSYDKRTFSISTSQLPGSLGVGLYRLTGSTLRYTTGSDAGYGSDYEDLGSYVLEFAVTDDAPAAPDAVDTTTTSATDKEDWQWYTTWDMIDDATGIPSATMTLDGPYFAHITSNGSWMTDDNGDEIYVDIYDRSTGNKLTAQSLTFNGDIYEDIMTDRDGHLFIQAADDVYCVSVEAGKVNITSGAQYPDADIPYGPISADSALDGEISARMSQEYYSVDSEEVTIILTNATDTEMTIQYTDNNWGLYRLRDGYFENCWRQSTDITEQITPEQKLITIAPGESQEFDISLDSWTYDSDDGEIDLDRGLYQVIFSQFTASTVGEDRSFCLTLEFALDG